MIGTLQRSFQLGRYGLHSYFDLQGRRVEAGSWSPTHYAYVSVGKEMRLLVSDGPGPLEVWGQKVTLARRGDESVKSLQSLKGPGTYFTVHKVMST